MVKYVIPPGVAAATELRPCHDKSILLTKSIRVKEAVDRMRGTATRRTCLYPPSLSLGITARPTDPSIWLPSGFFPVSLVVILSATFKRPTGTPGTVSLLKVQHAF
jgi:hypothetical protein